MNDSVLIIGSGGREHALAWKLSQSQRIKQIFVAPGNAGTHLDTSGKITNIALNIKNNEDIAKWCLDKKIDLVVVGPEDPLANGIADYLNKLKIKCFGPSQKAAQIEASKEFAKSFMDRHNIPTAKWESFTNVEDAEKHILSASYNALVVKASGLAAGKGVIVAASKEDAVKAVHSLKEDKGLSSASETIVIEELLEGEETSVLCFSDGINISVMPPAQDHKRLLDNDEGPNTGGMGAYCKCPLVSDDTLKFIEKNILQKAIDGMRAEGYPYVGVLYAGLMMTKNGPKVLEFNCRFGDPETQVILPLLSSDLYDVMLACVNGSLSETPIQWLSTKFAVGVVVVSGGYPGSYPKGKVITGFDKLPSADYIVFHAGTAMSENKVVTSGGRVLAVVALEETLEKAASKAKKGASEINFDGAFYRSDIAHKALKRSVIEGMTYKSSGVDIENADALVDKIKGLTKQTLRPGVCGGIGGFGGIFDLKAANFNDCYLIFRGSGIGEKLMVLQECNNYELLGYDLVANCTNENLAHGAEPLFFLDTYTSGKLDTSVAAKVIQGIVKGCKEANCVLIGGETAEMPGMYVDGDFDLTGFARGAVIKEKLLPQINKISKGDSVIALVSSAINPSGYGIIRRILRKEKLSLESPAPFAKNRIIKECVAVQNKIHVQSVLPLMKKDRIKAASYINEGGLSEGLNRILPTSYRIALDASKWSIPSIFSWMASAGQFSESEMLDNFNCGIDMVLIVDKNLETTVLDSLRASGEEAVVIGSVEANQKGDKGIQLLNSPFSTSKPLYEKTRIAIFTSSQGFGTEALIDHFHNPTSVSTSEIAVVFSDTNTSQGIVKAREQNIPTKVFDPRDFGTDQVIEDYLKPYNVQLICLDNFSSQLSDSFVKSWKGRILITHPSLIPAFDTSNAIKDMLDMKVKITGCTVAFLEPGKKFGGIIEQAATFVEPGDDEEILHKKVTQLQQYIYPKAVDLVASKRVLYMADNKVQRTDDDCIVPNTLKSNYSTLQTRINPLIESTARSGLINLHSSCGIFDIEASGFENPYLVSGTDGVGTKLKIAQIYNKHDTIGIDLVAMCVNDILTHGAEPFSFMQCFNCGKLNVDIASDVISGIVNGCKQANCTLINSEISELPDIYLDPKKCMPEFQNYDVVGYAEGAVEKNNLLPRMFDIKENDVLIGLESSGIHSNGYSLVRKLVKIRNLRYQDPAPFDPEKSLGEALLTPTKIYVKSLLPLMKKGYIKAAAHITGGGLTENIPRVLPEGYKVVLDGQKWTVPSVLKWIASEGQMSDREMLRTFNCGLGMVLIIGKEHEKEVLDLLKMSGENASNIGYVKAMVKGEEKVEVKNFHLNVQATKIKRKRVGVLISGSGTNLQALIDYTQNPSNQSKAEIVLVISNVPGVEGLKRAEKANIPTKVLSHKGFKSRVEFDMAVNDILQENGIEIVCLAGFMRILSKQFVEIWQGRLLNVHPAILPAFKGVNAHKLVLEAGARITGCTVHFVEPEVDAGAIIEQAAVRVEPNDTEKSLQEKVKVLEHQIFPTALELLASDKISRGKDGKLVWNF